MAFKNSFFSRLFNQGKDEADTEDEAVQAEEKQEEKARPASAPVQREPIRLTLPSEHPLNRLRDLRSKEVGYLPAPALELSELPDALTYDEARRELGRLQVTVTTTAKKRLEQIQPKRPKQAKGQNSGAGGAKGPNETEEAPTPDLDAQVVVFLSNGQMSAWVLLYPPVGKGKEIERDMLSRALSDNKVTTGIDEQMLDSIPGNENRYFHLFPVAKGRVAVPGKDGYVVDLFSRVQEQKITVDEHNRVDYTALSNVQNADEGDVICRIIPPTPGLPGTTVQGKALPARDGLKATPPKGRNTELNEDGTKLLAAKTGHVEFSGRGFCIKPVLDISGNVDFSTGNINFVGDVHVHGDVCSGFSVRALGNIMVEGVVEACVIEASGDLIIAGGVQGDNQAVIRSHRNIHAKFVENSSVYVRENLQTECIVNCEVYSDGTVDVCSGWGTIIGGKVRAAQEVSANVVGSRAENITNISLGGLPCEDFERGLLLEELEKLESEIEKTERQPESPFKFSSLAKMRMQVTVNRNKLAQMDKDLEKLDELLQDQKGQRLKCGLAYPGTIVTIGNASLRLEHETKPCTVALIEQEICLI